MATNQLVLPYDQTSNERKIPVVEVFGPTIQGEGVDQGTACYFVRFGGCDYKCTWCDTPHAVLPQMVRHASRLSSNEILEQLDRLSPGPRWIILSGGNPCLHDVDPLIRKLKSRGLLVALETQGTLWKQWVRMCNRVAVSPKPPSSGHTTDIKQLGSFMEKLHSSYAAFLKIVVFDHADYEFAQEVHRRFHEYRMFVSAGNDAGRTVGNPTRTDNRSDQEVALDLINNGRWLANRVMVDPKMQDVSVQMQNHVLYWGNQVGR